MNRHPNPARVFAFVLAACLLPSCADDDDTEGHTAIVNELVEIMRANDGLRGQVETALVHQDESPDWHGKTLEDLYDFFDQWLVFQPTPDDLRKYMDAFYDFSSSTEGRTAVLAQPFRDWLYRFMMARGAFMDSEKSAGVIPVWMSHPDVRIDDYVVPAAGFRSFNEFFIRQLKPGARPIDLPDDDAVLTSPADCTIINLDGALTPDTVIDVKGDRLHISELLGADERAGLFLNGRAILCMLAATNYHRFHSPTHGAIASDRQLAGLYYGMTGGWVDYFFEHRRGYFIFATDRFGYVGMVCVGMLTISSIEFIQATGDILRKGDELGHFAYGGSAIILLFEPGRIEFTIPIDEAPVDVRMGQKIGSAVLGVAAR